MQKEIVLNCLIDKINYCKKQFYPKCLDCFDNQKK
jgi:hypothetical protein